MAVTDGFRSFILEQLEQAARDIRWRRMFGGIGIYAGEHFFALIADDVLYFKVDDQTRPEYQAKNMQPFQPYGPDGETMGYYSVPIGVIEDSDELRMWVDGAVGVARRAKEKAISPRRRTRAAGTRPSPPKPARGRRRAAR